MATVRFSRRAEDDLLSIAAYTLRTWGEVQADRYLDGMEACCERLAKNPRLGRACGDLHPDWQRSMLRRMEHGKHVIFYKAQEDCILISRILHENMLPAGHLMDDES
jgi:toxin ParE1/3/4